MLLVNEDKHDSQHSALDSFLDIGQVKLDLSEIKYQGSK